MLMIWNIILVCHFVPEEHNLCPDRVQNHNDFPLFRSKVKRIIYHHMLICHLQFVYLWFVNSLPKIRLKRRWTSNRVIITFIHLFNLIYKPTPDWIYMLIELLAWLLYVERGRKSNEGEEKLRIKQGEEKRTRWRNKSKKEKKRKKGIS